MPSCRLVSQNWSDRTGSRLDGPKLCHTHWLISDPQTDATVVDDGAAGRQEVGLRDEALDAHVGALWQQLLRILVATHRDDQLDRLVGDGLVGMTRQIGDTASFAMPTQA